MIVMPVASAMEVKRARSRAVGMLEISCLKRFRRPCFSRVLSAVKSRSSTAMAFTPEVVAQCRSRVRAWRTWASRWVAGPVRPYEKRRGIADGVAVEVEVPGGEVVGVHVDSDHPLGQCCRQGDGAGDWFLPGRGHVPAGTYRVVVDAVGDGPVRGDAVDPLLPPVRKYHLAGQDVPAVRRVGQMSERSREPEGHLAVRGDADRLVPEAFPGLPVRLHKPPLGFPPLTPLGLGESGIGQVVPRVGEALAAPDHVHPPGFPVRAGTREPVLQDVQAPGLGMPLPPTPVSTRRVLRPLLAEGQRQPVLQRPHSRLQGRTCAWAPRRASAH
ncbi:hypothetical protein SAMN05428941_2471 [Streptomyces sp. 2114.2]|nr:hypothetical protein BX268_2476 [Streptomyces sp. 2221.1]SDT32474.1 hypothetical protein SAMN05428941_2471 [Streptomyces sp. 2114.2]